MALWGISTQSENWANSYAIPKFLKDGYIDVIKAMIILV
jgi:hypothetical protein